MKLLLATRNRKKLAELRRILAAAHLDVELVGLDEVADYPEAPEKGLTFAANAVAKARDGARETGLPTVADDSGIAVDALNGMPGVFSARWVGRHGDDGANLDLVLAQVSDVDDEFLGGSFVCAASLVLPDGREWTVEGVMPGHLIRERRGTGGFGYDPIFVASGQSQSNAELSAEAKDAISHRGKAFRGIAEILATL